jgi:hypothetical protein
MHLAYTNPADSRNLADPGESVLLDIQASFAILKAFSIRQPLTSIQEVPHGKTSQNVQAVLLMGRLPFHRESLNLILEKPNPP